MALRFVILNPCSKRWADLSGDGRKRFCPDCQTDIHALGQYSDAEIDDLRRESPGRLCGYLEGEPIEQPRSRRAVLVGAMLTAISPLMAQSGRVRMRITGGGGTVILTSAEASILGQDEKPTLTAHASASGEIVFADLPVGDSKIMVECPGFNRRTIILTIRNADEVTFDVELKVGLVGTFVDVSPPKKKRRRWWPFH